MKSNTIVIILLIYLAIFGVKMKTDSTLESGHRVDCAELKIVPTRAPDNIPIIDKAMLSNKDYVIRVLIKHIKSQNEHINESNTRISNITVIYNKCAI